MAQFLSKKETAKVAGAVVVVVLVIAVVECSIRVTGVLNTPSEKQFHEYVSYYQPRMSDYPKREPGHYVYTTSDFTYACRANSLGHRTPEPDKIAWLFLGDSFTEGVGASYDSTYVCFLNKMVDSSVQFYSAGVSGSDPVYDHNMLKRNIDLLCPELVFQSVNSSDFTDLYFRGGLNGEGHMAPPLEEFYQKSHTVRLFMWLMGYNETLLRDEKLENLGVEVTPIIIEVADSLKELSRKNGFDLQFVLIPAPFEPVYDSHLKKVFDHIEKVLSRRGFTVINLWEHVAGRIDRTTSNTVYGYRCDGHYTGLGYQLVAEGIFNQVYKTAPSVH